MPEQELEGPQGETALTEKEKISISLPLELTERVRNAVYWTPGLTLTEFTALALENTVSLMEVLRGSRFPQRRQKLKRGRQVSSV